MLFAAGMATKALQAVLQQIYSSTFLQRAFDQVVHDVALQNLPVVFCMDRGGLSGDDGPTHHGLFDISYLRGIPNIVHMSPKDEDELQDMMLTALEHDGPSAIRYPRGIGPGVAVKDFPVALKIGRAEVLQDGSDVADFCSRRDGWRRPMRLAKMLKAEGQSVAVINARFAKPIDAECVLKYARRCPLLITMEDHVLAGGFGSVWCWRRAERPEAASLKTPVVRVGWPDEFIEHGKPEALRAKYGLTAEAAMERVRGMLKRPVGV